MEASLQSMHITADDLNTSLSVEAEEEEHIHMPGPSLWPLILSAAILVEVVGLLFVPETPWLSLIAAPFVLVGILGWSMEDPMGSSHTGEFTQHKPIGPLDANTVLENARAQAEKIVTVSSTAFSVHPVKVEMEEKNENGVILAVHGKVELEAQREELETALRSVPGVAEVRNFVIAEDSILNSAYAAIDGLRAKGKLDGAKNITVLVENYILNLYGEVPTKAMKYALERELIGLPGVRVVVNHIGLNEDIPGNLGKTLNR